MQNRSALRAAALGLVLLPAGLLATGCSLIDEVIHKEQKLEFADRQALVDGWKRDAPWVPADAVAITGMAKTDSAVATIMLRSGEELDPAICAEVPRQSAPVYALSDAPNIYEMNTVHACGEWSVVATGHGWLGWTPNHPDEAAQSPAS